MEAIKRCKKAKGFGTTKSCDKLIKPKKLAAMGRGSKSFAKSPGGGKGLAKGVSGYKR